MERTIKKEGAGSISVFITEPIIGTTAPGVTPPPEYYKTIREICDKYNILMIVDEVITGFGRKGNNFGINHWNITRYYRHRKGDKQCLYTSCRSYCP